MILNKQTIQEKINNVSNKLTLVSFDIINKNCVVELIHDDYKNRPFKRYLQYVVKNKIIHHPLERKKIDRNKLLNIFKKNLLKLTDRLILIESSFINMNTKCDFIHVDYPNDIIKRSPRGVIYDKCINHPKIYNELRVKNRRNNIEDIKLKVLSYSDRILFADNKYTNNKCKYLFFDKVDNCYFYSTIGNVLSGHIKGSPNSTLERRKISNIYKYGVDSPTKNLEIQLKSARSVNNRYIKVHWKTKKELVCVGSYESKTVDYFNSNKIDFIWHPMAFKCSDNRVYFVDLYLPDTDKYVEIKGYFRKDAINKWNEFKQSYPNSELWDKPTLTKMRIL